MALWLGVDVGAERKGFDVALIDERSLLELRGGLSMASVVELAVARSPVLVGVDSPRTCAPDGHTARADERELRRRVCGIRWTPDLAHVQTGGYYAWVRHGLALFDALAGRDMAVIEVFPTASWTRWCGPRGAISRARWSREGVRALGLAGVPARTNQDQRDAIAAAVTARQHTHGLTEAIGEIVVPPVRDKGRLEAQIAQSRLPEAGAPALLDPGKAPHQQRDGPRRHEQADDHIAQRVDVHL
jgi:predicted nuclease with RNAse H fold